MAARFRRGSSIIVVAAWAVSAVLGPIPASAAEGDLDPGLGTGGTVVTAFPGGEASSNALAIQADGKIVVVGASAGPSNTGEFAVARYRTDGSLDPTFSKNGKLTTPIAGGEGDEARSVAIQANGRIVVAGTDSLRKFAVVRYRSNGALDPTFGGNGIVRTDMTRGDDIAYDLVIQADGKIVLVGGVGQPQPTFGLARYRSNGALDPTFGQRGKVFTGGGTWVARAVALQPNGRLVVAGYNKLGLAVARYRPDGRLDSSFSGDGKLDQNVSAPQHAIFALDVAIQPDGRIVTAGDYDIFQVGLARITVAGRLDRTFGGDGVVRTGLGKGEQAISGLVIQPSGKIVAAAAAGPHESSDTIVWRFVITRYRKDGTLDRTWGGDGKVRTDFPGGGWARGAAAQDDGKIVVAGGAGGGFALARYLA